MTDVIADATKKKCSLCGGTGRQYFPETKRSVACPLCNPGGSPSPKLWKDLTPYQQMLGLVEWLNDGVGLSGVNDTPHKLSINLLNQAVGGAHDILTELNERKIDFDLTEARHVLDRPYDDDWPRDVSATLRAALDKLEVYMADAYPDPRRSIAIDLERYARVERLADRAGLTVEEWIERLLDVADRTLPELARLIAEMDDVIPEL